MERAARQTLIEKDSFAPPDLFLVVKGVCELYSAFSLSGDNDLGYRICANPVSYTHLDVYKRQV